MFLKDLKNQNLEETLKRYLSSKNLTKDSIGVSKLTNKDISYIENGCANHIYTNSFSLEARIYLVLWQINNYKTTGNTNNQSLLHRIEFYKAGFNAAKENFWFGTGSGDLFLETHRQLEQLNSKLEKKYWHVVYNQFLAEFVLLGMIGFLLFNQFLP